MSDLPRTAHTFLPGQGLKKPQSPTGIASTGLRARRVRRRFEALRPVTSDVVVPCGDGVRLQAHFTPFKSGAPLIVLIHGWEGSAESIYLLSATMAMHAAGFSVLRLNLRDHGGSHALNEDLFHSCRLQEVVDAVAWAGEQYRPDRLLVGGFSLGGNFSLRVAAVAPAQGLSLQRAVAVCPVLDPAETMHALDDGWFVYRRYFLHKWRKSLEMKMAAFPGRYDFGPLGRFTTLMGMTEYFVLNHTDYPDLYNYLHDYSLIRGRLDDLSVDSRVLLAGDDPIIPVGGLDRFSPGPAFHAEVTRFGGHCGYLEGWGLRSWASAWMVQAAQLP